jgi:hypothetical protein
LEAGRLLTTGSVVVPKWAVLPVSAMIEARARGGGGRFVKKIDYSIDF